MQSYFPYRLRLALGLGIVLACVGSLIHAPAWLIVLGGLLCAGGLVAIVWTLASG